MLALSISALFSGWMLFGGPSVNTDGVIYLNAANAFIKSGFAGAVQIYGWPFYSILIALVAKLGLTLEASAALLNLVFFAALAWAFVTATEQLYPNQKKIHYLAAAIILLEPYVNSLRDSFFRDNGHVACMLLSLVALLRYAGSGKPLALLAWLLLTIAAALFRPEALLLLPAGIFSMVYARGNWKAGLALLLLALCAGTAAFWWLHEYAPQSRTRDALTWWNYYTTEFGNTFAGKASLLEKTVLGEFSDNGTEALIAALLVTLLAAVIGVLTPLHAAVLWWKRKVPLYLAPVHAKILWAYALATLAPPALFVVMSYFVSQRYVLAFALILLLLLAPRLISAIAGIRPRPLRFAVITLLVLFFSIASYRNLKIEAELKEAGLWLSQQSGSVWTNSIPVAYYVESRDAGRMVVTQNLASAAADFSQINTDWAAVVVAKRDADTIPALLLQLHGTESQRFAGGGRFVVIIKR
jgi:hypothetical protein